VWIGTAANLVKFDGSNWKVFNEPAGKDWINDIFVESENMLWLGTKMDGIRTFINENFDSLLIVEYNYQSNSISSICKDANSLIWIGFTPDSAGRGGLSFYDGFQFFNLNLGSSQNNVNNIFIDENNNRWSATTEGLYFNELTVYRISNSLISSNNTRASVRDHNGNVWITTNASGLNKFKLAN
jgi:ligand-binding sensor domain-containing protein